MIRLRLGLDRLLARRALDRLRRLAEGAQERAPHALGVGEARLAGDHVDRVVAGLDHGARRLDPQHLDRARRRLPGLEAEAAAELARAEVGRLGQLVDRQRPPQVALGISERLLDAVRFRLQLEQGRELRLAAAAAVVDHHVARDVLRRVLAQVFLHHRQAQVDAGGHAGRGPHAAVVDVDAVFLDARLWTGALQVARQGPVGGRAAAVDQAGLGQDEGAGADAGGAARGRAGFAQEVQEGRARLEADRGHDAGHDQGVVVAPVESFGEHADAGRAGEHPAVLRQHGHVIERPAVETVGDLEHGGGHQVERLEAGREQESDSAFHDDPGMRNRENNTPRRAGRAEVLHLSVEAGSQNVPAGADVDP